MTTIDLTPRPFVPDADGIFSMPNEAYHKAPGFSRSMVTPIEKSPAHLLSYQHEPPKAKSEALIVGDLYDHALLEPHLFGEGKSHWVRPEGMLFTTTEGKAWKKERLEQAALPIVDSETANHLKQMVAAVMATKLGRKFVCEGVVQRSVFCHDPSTGVNRKSRPDIMINDSTGRACQIDLKSAASVEEVEFSKKCARFLYHVQNSNYVDTYRDLTGETPHFIFMAAEKTPPYAVRFFRLDEDAVAEGRRRFRKALDTYARCLENNEWPLPTEEITTLRLPRWALDPQSPIIPD